MREKCVRYLACPQCHGDLTIRSVEKRCGEMLETAELACVDCAATYPIIHSIPRFVPDANYARFWT